MAKLIKNIPVSFNLLDPDQKAMYEHVCERTNKSGYLKRLIQRDMEGHHQQVLKAFEPELLNDDLMGGLI